MDFLSDEDKKKLEQYTSDLSTEDPKKVAMRKYFESVRQDNAKVSELLQKSQVNPEEQAFLDEKAGPFVQGIMQGGVMGSVGKVVPAFNRLQQVMSVGKKSFPVQNTAQGLQKMEQLGIPKSPFGRVIIKD